MANNLPMVGRRWWGR